MKMGDKNAFCGINFLKWGTEMYSYFFLIVEFVVYPNVVLLISFMKVFHPVS